MIDLPLCAKFGYDQASTGRVDMAGIHANARTAAGFNSPADDEDTGERRPVEGAVLNRTRLELTKIANERRLLAERERDVKKDFVSNGGTKGVLAMLMKLDKMEPDDRTDFLNELDTYAAFLQYW